MTAPQRATAAPAPAVTACPLCGDARGRCLAETSYAEIWRQLAREWGADVTAEVVAAHSPAATVALRRCDGCGLDYFTPAVAGSARFYAELTSSSPTYYNGVKWEFERVRALVRPHHRVLDVACGGGAFLASLGGAVRDAVGLDTNPAVARGGARPILCTSIEDFAPGHRGQFDVVTAFQVIEHVDAVMPFVRAAYACVRPGGRLALSVPSRDRYRDAEFGSLDHPPHHLSRWSGAQLAFIADALGARVELVAKEPLAAPQAIAALRRDVLPALVPVRFAGRDLAFKLASRLAFTAPLSRLSARLGLATRLGLHGMSLLIVLAKPEAPCAA